MSHRARVFISCGQSATLGEVSAARAVAQALNDLGFDPYIAVEQQTLAGVKENIFRVLQEAEYYLFIDFKREALVGDGDTECRGSVFTHQELALAAFLDKDVIALREEGVRKLDGIVGFLQTNAVPFTDRTAIPSMVMARIKDRGWSPDSYNGLMLSANDPRFRDAHNPSNDVGRYFHIRVTNGQKKKAAEDCLAYLDEIRHEDGGPSPHYETVELKWAGYVFPSARIAPGGTRLLDAVWVRHARPDLPEFNTFADSTDFIPVFAGTGGWILRFSVVSSTVRGATREFRLVVSERLGDVSLEPFG